MQAGKKYKTCTAFVQHEGPFPTCKGTTRPDRLFISPELATYFVKCEVADLFSDHSVVTGHFDIPVSASTYSWWPMPSKIPWSSVDFEAWRNAQISCQPFDVSVGSSTEYLTYLARGYESSLNSDVLPNVPAGLPPACRGRAQTFHPVDRPRNLRTLKPSRTGEEQPRSDLVSHSVQRWFRQLRRLQSLVHNLRRNSGSPNALCYRLDTWRSIKTACGFAGTFPVWWSSRPCQLPGAPCSLPDLLPSLGVVELIYEDFKLNYRAFESWHIRHRCETLRTVLRTDMRKAFQSLRPQASSGPDRFIAFTAAQVVDVEAETCLVHVDRPLTPAMQTTWTLDDEPARVTQLDPQLFEVHSSLPLLPGQELGMHVQITESQDMHQHLQEFWTSRWEKFENVPEDRWNRLMGFVRAYMPSIQLTLPPISGQLWDQINSRYSAQAARGPDGFDHLDLQNMPGCFREGLISLLNGIESGAPWPKQLLKAFCHPLPKHDCASFVGEYRPIVILSVIHRSWSALRSRSLLQQLKHHVGNGVVGFMPSRETGEIWHYVQALLECSFQHDVNLTGVVSDVRKAFESIPRTCFFAVARFFAGLPSSLLSAWSRFLAGFERHFLLRDHFGPPISSNWGLPEGCGLSVVAMTIIDWCWDIYQSVFAPATVPLSYVDNYEVLAHSIGELLTGYATLETFMELWALELDGSKTYFWSTSTSDRGALRSLGKTVCLQRADLGGAMTYSRRNGMGSQRARLDSLQPMWSRLKRSFVPLPIKWLLLRQAFWSKAFHAIGITLLPFQQIGKLRTQAVRALGFGHAGANPGLRLALLCGNMQTDPGFYQVVRVLDDFRRFASKNPHVIDLWQSFCQNFEGRLWSGPFSKLFEIFEQIGWSIKDPPWIWDHDFCSWNLLDLPTSLLHPLLEDAWLQRLSREVSHRQDFAGLIGLSWPASSHESRLTLQDVASVNAIREGAFYVGSQQGKFDLKKGQLCPFCQQPDTVQHRCIHCPALAPARIRHSLIVSKWDQLPVVTTEHLLSSRNPHYVRRKRALLALPDLVACFSPQVTPTGDWIDFFTDGSVWEPNNPQLSLAAWATVSATHGCVASMGPLPGLMQNINRAELMAALSAVIWAQENQTKCTIWTDSSYVGSGLAALIQDPYVGSFDSNEDLWQRLKESLQRIPDGYLRVQHVNSHRQIGDSEDPLDDWLIYWNAVADKNAGIAHSYRSAEFREIHQAFRDRHLNSEQNIDRLRDLHLEVGSLRRTLLPATDSVPDDEPEEVKVVRPWVLDTDWLDAVPLGWQTQWQQSTSGFIFPAGIVRLLLDILMTERDRAEGIVQISWLEFAAMVFCLGFQHPLQVVEGGQTCWRPALSCPAAINGQLTVGARVRFLKSFVGIFDKMFSCDVAFVSGLNCAHLGIYPPQKGLAVSMSASLQDAVDNLLLQWTAKRPVRTANDLVRPF